MLKRSLVRRAVRHKFAVTLKSGEGAFSGVLTGVDAASFVFEQCATVPASRDETPNPIPGRVFVDRVSVAYLQEVL